MTSTADWRRLSPVTLGYFIVKGIPHLVNLWPALVIVWASGETLRGVFWPYGIYLIVISLSLMALLPYWFFRYQIAEDHIQIRSGVLQRKRLTLYFDRVQQADIAQPFYFRPFNLAILGLESAGSTQQEVDLPGLPLGQAQDLKRRILEQRRTSEKAQAKPSGADIGESDSVAPDYELRLPWHEVARYGLMRNGLLLLLPVVAPLIQNWLPYLEIWLLPLEHSPIHQHMQSFAQYNLAAVMVIASTMAVISGIVIIYGASAGIALIRFWDYHLTRTGDQYQYRAGLTTVKTRGFRLHKLQLVTVSQGLVARWLRRYTLSISKAGGGPQQGEQSQQRFLIPVLTKANLAILQQQLGIPEPHWRRVAPFYVIGSGITGGTLLSVVAAFVLVMNQAPFWPALLLYPLYGLIAWRRWWCMGLFHDSKWIAVKTGFVGRKTRWLPIVKVQKIVLSEPPWLSPFGLINVSIWSADGILRLPCVTQETATKLRDETLCRTGKFRGAWL